MAGIKRALISVSDKTGVTEMAKGLEALGAEILSTGGTAKALRDAGVKVTDVAAYTGSPEILDGRVKTLHPKIHGGLLGRRSLPAHVEQMKQHQIGPIDVVVVNLYPFEATIAKLNCPFEEAIENIDIGGPSMLRSAAKNHEDVLVVVDPADYSRVLDAAKSGDVPHALRRELAMKVFQHTARYDSLIAGYLEKQVQGGEVKFPKILSLQYELGETLRYGENPHQQGAFYRELHSNDARQVHHVPGKHCSRVPVYAGRSRANQDHCPPRRGIPLVVRHSVGARQSVARDGPIRSVARTGGAERVDPDHAWLRVDALFMGHAHDRVALARSRTRYWRRTRAGTTPPRTRFKAILRVDGAPSKRRF